MVEARLTLVLHCHLPYVRHPEHERFLEEDWLHEAVAETYVPLLLMLEGAEEEGLDFRLALSLSPTLCEMLSNRLLTQRCRRYLEEHVELAEREVERTRGTPLQAAARFYRRFYQRARETFVERFGGRLLRGFAGLAERGRVELLGSCATHALLPLMDGDASRRAQVAAGLRNFRKHFGGRPNGFWLPECAYRPGVEELLAEFGIRYFFVDTHGILLGRPRPPFGVFAPLVTPPGPAALGRDVESSRQVWSAEEGYPGDPAYREFYRDLGFEAELDYLRPYLPDGRRRYLGFKYHRITGDVPAERKEPYRPEAARRKARQHAEHFVDERCRQVRRVHDRLGLRPLIVCPYDAELFGHWWLEGPQFLHAVARASAARPELRWLTPCRAVGRFWADRPAGLQRGTPAFSSWGYRGYLENWVNGSNDWVYPRLERAAGRMRRAAGRRPDAEGVRRRALDQCARELLLAQAGDWPFLMSTDTAREYAAERFKVLMDRFDGLLEQALNGGVDMDLLRRCEAADDAFPEVDYSLFAPRGQ